MPNFSNYFVDLERPSRHRSHLTSIKHIRCQHGHAIRRVIMEVFRSEGEAGQLIHSPAVVLIPAADIEEIPLRFYELTTEFFGAVFGFCCSEMLVVIREYSDFMVENSETTWWNEGTP